MKKIAIEAFKPSLVLSFMLSAVLVTAIFSAYDTPVISVWNLISVLICGASFALCRYVDIHRGYRSLYIVVAFAFALLAFGNAISDIGYLIGFMQCLLTGEAEDKNRFLIALLTIFPIFFSTTVYYMSNVAYRISYLTLISIIPCVLYVKIAYDMDNAYIALIAIINMGIYIAHSYTSKNSGERVIGGRNAFIAALGFVLAVLMVVSVIPKEDEARYYDLFEAKFMNGNIGLPVGESFSKLGDTSGNADNYKDLNNRRLYNVYGKNVPYLKRQNFDYYDFSNDNWYSDKELKRLHYTPEEWFERGRKRNLTALQAAIKTAEEYSPDFATKYGLEEIANSDTIIDSLNPIYVQATNFETIYYLASARCVSVNVRTPRDLYYVTQSGTFRSVRNKHQADIVYQINTYDEFDVVGSWLELGGSNINEATEKNMLYELNNVLEENNSPFAEFTQEYIQLDDEARTYKKSCETNTSKISAQVKELAEKITKNCTYDWEKAEALQNYFYDNDFVYDIEYTSEDTSPEYFLFESKTGTCSDFASAYVLLARAVGLTVRYTEGFAPEATDEEGLYTISDSNSHAYPEVYIQNIGWLVYEPTVASEYNSFEDKGKSNWFDFSVLKLDTGLFSAIACMSVTVLILLLFARFVVPAVQELMFMRKIKMKSPAWCVLLVYKRIAGKTTVRLTGDNSSRTPYELANLLENRIGSNIYPIAFILESAVYGGVQPTEEEKREVIEIYVKLKEEIREFKKRSKRNKKQ
jgi:transglutaminase-like putative cysteine protease